MCEVQDTTHEMFERHNPTLIGHREMGKSQAKLVAAENRSYVPQVATFLT